MDSKLNAPSLWAVAAATVLSGAAFYLSQGLQPQWWAAWMAPLPILWIAPRLSRPKASASALAAAIIGGLSMWSYHARLQFPMWLQLASVLVPALAFCGAVLVFRGFYKRDALWPAVLAFPSVMVAYEYLLSLFNGTFGVTAYTQLNNPPVLQLGALTGLWGISFIVMLFPSMIAAAFSTSRARWQFGITLALVLAFTLTYGVSRLASSSGPVPTIVTGFVVSDVPKNLLPEKDPDVLQLLTAYSEQVRQLAGRGARIVLLPEMTALVRDSITAQVDQLFDQTAKQANIQIVAGVLHATSNGTFNEARLYSDAATPPVVYRKHHLVPVVEGRTTPGSDISVIPHPVGTLGLAICRDMDYPDPSRRYGQARAGLLLVPAWDFNIDRYWHGHMSIMRGVENGYTVARAAKQGLLTVSDNRGRILAETKTTPSDAFTTMLTAVPVHHEPTLYQSWGDWFAWLNLALVAGLFILIAAKRPLPGTPAQKHTDELTRVSSARYE